MFYNKNLSSNITLNFRDSGATFSSTRESLLQYFSLCTESEMDRTTTEIGRLSVLCGYKNGE